MFDYIYEKESVYKASAFSKHEVSIKIGFFVNEIIAIKGISTKGGKDSFVDITIEINDYTTVKSTTYKNANGVEITGNIESQEGRSDYVTVIVPNIEDVDEINAAIEKGREIKRNRLEKANKKKEEMKEQRTALKDEDGSLAAKQDEFYAAEYTSYIDKYSAFILDQHYEYSTFIYIDKRKSINIKSVDKKKMHAVTATIERAAIHFYEEAGRIPSSVYDNLSIMASLDPSKLIMIPSSIGTLLFSHMHLVPTTLIGYDKERFAPGEVNLSTLYKSTEAATITDSNVILDFFVEKDGHYVSIELPSDIMDFLIQTIGEIRIEGVAPAPVAPAPEPAPAEPKPEPASKPDSTPAKPAAKPDTTPAKPAPAPAPGKPVPKSDVANKAPTPNAPSNEKPTVRKPAAPEKVEKVDKVEMPTGKLTLEEMEEAVKKLKFMVDYEIITQEEFEVKKAELLKNLV